MISAVDGALGSQVQRHPETHLLCGMTVGLNASVQEACVKGEEKEERTVILRVLNVDLKTRLRSRPDPTALPVGKPRRSAV